MKFYVGIYDSEFAKKTTKAICNWRRRVVLNDCFLHSTPKLFATSWHDGSLWWVSYLLLNDMVVVCGEESYLLLPDMVVVCGGESYLLLPDMVVVCGEESYLLLPAINHLRLRTWNKHSRVHSEMMSNIRRMCIDERISVTISDLLTFYAVCF